MAAPVGRGLAACGDLVLDELDFERVVAEELQGLVLADDHALEGELFADDLLRGLVDLRVVVPGQVLLAHVGVVEEARVERRPDAQLRSVGPLEAGAQHVGRGVPEDGLAFGVVEAQQVELAVALERPGQVDQLEPWLFGLLGVVLVSAVNVLAAQSPEVLDLRGEHSLSQTAADLLGHVQSSRFVRSPRLD